MMNKLPQKLNNSIALILATLLSACSAQFVFPPSIPRPTLLATKPKPSPGATPKHTPTRAETLNFAFSTDYGRFKQLLMSASAQDIDQSHVMLKAVQLEQLELMNLMFLRGANPNANDGILPLRQAVRNSNNRLVQFLLQHGADPNAKDDNTDSILQEAIFNNQYTSFLSLDQNIEQFPQIGEQRMESVRLILASGANPNDRSRSNGRTVLMVASGQGKDQLVGLLLKRGANPKAVSAYGETALHYAAWRGNTDVVQQLLARKVDVNSTDYLGRTPLIFAVRRGSLPLVKLLLNHGANVNAASRETFVQPNKVTYGYQSVLDHALKANHLDVVTMLSQRGAKPFK